MSQPTRTCVVCRKTGTKLQLLRFVLETGGGIAADLHGIRYGRGAYCHSTLQCLGDKKSLRVMQSALQRGSSGRTVSVDPETTLTGLVREELERIKDSAAKNPKYAARIKQIRALTAEQSGKDVKQPGNRKAVHPIGRRKNS